MVNPISKRTNQSNYPLLQRNFPFTATMNMPHQPLCHVAKARSSTFATRPTTTSKVAQLRRKRFFVLVRILLKRLERDDPEGYRRAKEVSVIAVPSNRSSCRRMLLSLLFQLVRRKQQRTYSSQHIFGVILLHIHCRSYENAQKRTVREPLTSFHSSTPSIKI